MAKVKIERAYIEPSEQEQDFAILIHIKEGNDHILAGKIELNQPLKWLYTENAKNGDLIINNSESMEKHKWDHITREIIDGVL
ncbi:hypothetical protein UFOVP204_163 [uncultured Caudovirales phage]|uniref:Uncharacterized protein n=1 Tax=uncultured Caudovirales phage TaxID=2100421 RepID=A0A6J7WJV6_9CAUD|nr:hypothetical protein UFOVP204_163 [uncultured Caudovirales phage]